MSDYSSIGDSPKKDDPKTHSIEDRLKRHGRGLVFNRCLIVLLLIAASVTSWYYQTEVMLLKQELKADERTIANLRVMVDQHNNFLKHFNVSISNANVMQELKNIGSQVNLSQQIVQIELNATQRTIQAQLNATEKQLQLTVQQARQQINLQVANVKKDLWSYSQKTKSQLSMQNNFMIFQLAGTFSLLACLISMWHMTAHLRKFHKPRIQRKILAILWMVPIYAITSWLSLVFTAATGYLTIVKDFYEAYIIYQFLSFCIAVLAQGDRDRVVDLLADHADHLSPPFRFDAWCNKNPYPTDRALAEAVLMECQAFAMQFVFFRPLTAIALFVLQKLNYSGPTPILLGIQNLSIFLAFAGLLKFYHAVDKELSWCKPFAKFLCIKGLVFMTFWQGLAITILANSTKSKAVRAQWAESAQNFLVCLEMLLFSIAHFYTYPTDEWSENYQEKMKERQRVDRHFGDSLALNDFLSDLKLIIRGSAKRKKKKKKKTKKQPTIETVEEHENEDDDDTSEALTVTSLSSELSLDDAAFEAATQRLLSHRFLNYRADLDDMGELDDSPLTRVGTGTTQTIGADRIAEIMRRHSKITPPPSVSTKSSNTLLDEEGDEENLLTPSSADSARDEEEAEEEEGEEEVEVAVAVEQGQEEEEEEDPPSETTGLLSTSTPNTYGNEERFTHGDAEIALRPSFFTTVDAIGNSPDQKKDM